MKPSTMSSSLVLSIAALAVAGCGQDHGSGGSGSAAGIRQTGFPGQVSAGGTTSGQVMAQASQNKQATMPSGTPGIPKGAEGNVGGTQMGGSAQGASASASGPPAGEAASATPAAPATPPVREGRGETAPDASTASSSVPKGNIANAPAPAEQAKKEKAK